VAFIPATYRAEIVDMRIAEVMTSKPFTIRRDKRLKVVQTIMEWGRFRHLPVVDQYDRLVGIVSQTDVLAASASTFDPETPRAQRELLLAEIPIEKVMQHNVIAADAAEPVAAAAKRMREHRVSCLPVVDKGKLVGIVTAFDLLAVLADTAR